MVDGDFPARVDLRNGGSEVSYGCSGGNVDWSRGEESRISE